MSEEEIGQPSDDKKDSFTEIGHFERFRVYWKPSTGEVELSAHFSWPLFDSHSETEFFQIEERAGNQDDAMAIARAWLGRYHSYALRGGRLRKMKTIRNSDEEGRILNALVEKHGMEVFRFMEARSLQVLFCCGRGVSEVSCQEVAEALVGSSKALRQFIFHNMNRIQRRTVQEHLEWLESSLPPSLNPGEAGRKLITLARKLEMDGSIVFSIDLRRRLDFPSPPNPDLFPDRQGEDHRVWQWLRRLTGSEHQPEQRHFSEIEKLPDFHLMEKSLTEIIDYWVAAAYGPRKDGPMAFDALLDKRLDDSTRHLLELALSDIPDDAYLHRSTQMAAALREPIQFRYTAMRTTVGGIVRGETLQALARRLNALCSDGPLDPERPWIVPKYRQAPPVRQEATREALLETLMLIAAYAGGNGVLSLESVETNDPFFQQAANLAVDGVDALMLEEMMADKQEALLHDLQTRQRIVAAALLGIRRGTNPRMLEGRLMSFLPLWAMPREQA